jgi:hypothetical protein
MHVMAGDDTRDALDVVFDVGDLDVVWCGLEEDLGCCGRERDGGTEDDERDEERDCRVGVEAAWEVGEPDDERCDDDADVAESVADNVKNHSIHAHITMVMPMSTTTLLLLRVSMVVVVMQVILLDCPVRIVLHICAGRIVRVKPERRVLSNIRMRRTKCQLRIAVVVIPRVDVLHATGLDDLRPEASRVDLNVLCKAADAA